MKIERGNKKDRLDEERDRNDRYRKQRNHAEEKVEKVKKDYNAVVKELRTLCEQSKVKDDVINRMKKDRDVEVFRNVDVKDEMKTEMQQVNAATKEDNGGKKNETTAEYIEEKEKEDDTMVKYIGEKSVAEKSAEKKSAERSLP